jgi:glyoxalase superfamily protein
VTARLEQWTLDVRDVATMARFWAAVLGYRIGDDGQHLWPPPDAGPHAPSVWLQPVDAPTPGKNRGHPDLVPVDGDVDAEVERLLGLGAQRVDVGQSGDEGFVVLADPEGNEFCVLRGRRADGRRGS